MTTKTVETRYIVFLEKREGDSSDNYFYRVIDVLMPGLRTEGDCDVNTAKCLGIVFPNAVSNFKIVENEVILGWQEDAFMVFEKLIKNLPSVLRVIGMDEMSSQSNSREYDDEEEEPWDADLLEEERITNPPSRTLLRERDRELVEVSADVFDYGTLPESTPEPGEPGFHWGM